MPPPPDSSMLNTPLAPSVEKAYYRKCIELKRRLNEVEAANDEAKIRRVRLDRGITKMRLERAFLLDELRKRMDHNVDGSEGSADEGMATPPPDRPHRDKRRRHMPPQPAAPPPAPSSHSHQPARAPSQSEAGGPSAAAASSAHPPSQERQQPLPSAPAYSSQPAPSAQDGSPYGPVNGNGNVEATNDREAEREHGSNAPTNREEGAAGDPLGAGPTIKETNGERKIVSSAADDANAEGEQGQRSSEAAVGFKAVNEG